MRMFNQKDLYRIASMYYNEGLSQQEISEKERISRPQISRMLSQAREVGIVKISLFDPELAECTRVARELSEVTGLKNVHIVSYDDAYSSGNEFPLASIDVFARNAAPIILNLLECSVLIGVGWGRTVYNVVQNMHPSTTALENRLVFPLCGSISGVTSPEYQNSVVSLMLASKLHCKNFFLNNSSNLPKTELVNSNEKESIMTLESYWDSLDTAIFSVGTGHYNKDGVPPFMNTDDNAQLAGDILLQMYYTDGGLADVTAGNLIAISLKKLKSIPKSILISIGEEKVKAICYAIRLGFCNTLVTDIYTAKSIIKYYSSI